MSWDPAQVSAVKILMTRYPGLEFAELVSMEMKEIATGRPQHRPGCAQMSSQCAGAADEVLGRVRTKVLAPVVREQSVTEIAADVPKERVQQVR